jgi:hypothetical protein
MKSKLPPRMPPHYTLPRLQDFKFDEVLSALEHAGWNRVTASDGADDAVLYNAITREGEIEKEILWVIKNYIAARAFAIDPSVFRAAIKDLESALTELLRQFPDPQSLTYNAIHRALKSGAEADSPDLLSLKDDLEKLLGAIKAIRASEGGRGRDADRAGHQLTTDLMDIFERLTGQRPGRGDSKEGDAAITGRFARFVTVVGNLLPDDFKLGDIDNLISVQKTHRPCGVIPSLFAFFYRIESPPAYCYLSRHSMDGM